MFQTVCILQALIFLLDEMMKQLKNTPDNKGVLVASWKFIAGDVNYRAMHLFKYPEVSVVNSITLIQNIFGLYIEL